MAVSLLSQDCMKRRAKQPNIVWAKRSPINVKPIITLNNDNFNSNIYNNKFM